MFGAGMTTKILKRHNGAMLIDCAICDSGGRKVEPLYLVMMRGVKAYEGPLLTVATAAFEKATTRPSSQPKSGALP